MLEYFGVYVPNVKRVCELVRQDENKCQPRKNISSPYMLALQIEVILDVSSEKGTEVGFGWLGSTSFLSSVSCRCFCTFVVFP